MAKRSKKGVTFVLSERSMRDPQSLDPEAPQHIPLPVNTNKTSADKSYEKFLGIEYDDDTDYLAFMKANPDEEETQQTGFMTKDEVQDMISGTKDIYGGYVDPEVAHMLEEDNEDGEDRFETVQTMADIEKDGENEIGIDDFVMNLKGNSDDEDIPEEDSQHKDLSYSMMQFLGEDTMPQASSSLRRNVRQTIPEGEEIEEFDQDEEDFDDDFDRQTKFTEYSMSSSVMNRSEHLTQIDDTFEEFMEEFWDDDVGDMENQAEDIYNVSAETNEAATYRLMNMHNRQLQDNMPVYGDALDPAENEKEALVRKTIELMQTQKEVPEDYDPGLEVIALMEAGREPKPQYDCESILSTKSNLYNRPKYVDESKTLLKNKIQLNKMGLPMGPGASFKQLKKAQKQMDRNNNEVNSDGDDDMSQMTSLTVLLNEASIRNKNESPAERKQRKQLVKELRKARREERKNTRIAFREEGIKQAKAEINRSRDTAIRL